MPKLTKRRVSEAQDLEQSYRLADRVSHPHLAIKLLILHNKYLIIRKYTPIYTPK